ncbi:MAG: amino acid ABC transporter ATP-binding protein [Vicinamibacterales bacterium]
MSGPVLAIRGLRVARGARTIVDGVTFAVGRGELVALMGPSGSGKTTLLRAIAGLDAFAAGEVNVCGVTLTANGLPRAAVRRAVHSRVGMVFQFHHLFEHMTALGNVSLAPMHVQRMPRHDAERRARVLLEMLGVGELAGSMPHELSGGEAQRVAIARALAVDPPLLLMDEPTASLDAGRRGELAATLRDLASEGRALVVATHDEEFARACATRVVRIVDGRVGDAS